MGLIALAYLISHQWGLLLNNELVVTNKVHGCLAKSIFRYGLDNLKHAMRVIEKSNKQL